MKIILYPKVIGLVGDLTDQAVDVVVNAANSTLLGGGGVDGAIHRKGGPSILEACQQLRRTQYPDGLPTGEVVATVAGNLPAKAVIHTVGPIYGQENGQESRLLGACYRNALALAVEKGWKTIAFPAISTGIYGYPPAFAASVVSDALLEFLLDDPPIAEIRLVFHQLSALKIFEKSHHFPHDVS